MAGRGGTTNGSGVTQLLVIRHGETIWNAAGRQQGHLDSDLTPLGLRQAEALARRLGSDPPGALYSSDLARAMRTAEPIARATGLEIRTDARLRERHLGILQGLTPAECREHHAECYGRLASGDPDYVIPEGESARHRYDAVIACAEEIAASHAGQRVAVVTHGGVLSAIFRRVAGLPLGAPRRCALWNASINVVAIENGSWMLWQWGDTHHLADLKTSDDDDVSRPRRKLHWT